jgi:hypothetical protein
MSELILAFALTFYALGVQAQQLEPGEWDFATTVTAPGLPRPTQTGMRTCVTKEQSRDPTRWGSNPQQPADCRVTTLKLGPDTLSWEMECAGSGMRGAGKARFGRNSVESEVQLGSPAGGIDLRMKTSGRRLGPCKL